MNGLNSLNDLLQIDRKDVARDVSKPANLHLTSVDAYRIAVSLVGLGILPKEIIPEIKKELGLHDKIVPTIMHSNQHYHLMRWLKAKGIGNIGDKEFELLKAEMPEITFSESQE